MSAPTTSDLGALFRGFEAFYNNAEFSDLTITCGAHSWQVHRVVVSANCDFFKKACSGGFKEAEDQVVDLKDDDPCAVAAIIYYLYHGTYKCEDCSIDTVELQFHLQVYLLGDKYGVRGPADFAKNDIFDLLEDMWNTWDFADMIETVYSASLPDHDIRRKLLIVTRKHRQDLFNHAEDYGRFNEVAKSTPQFMYDLLQMHAAFNRSPKMTRRVRGASHAELHEGLEVLEEIEDELDESAPYYVGVQAEIERVYEMHWERLTTAGF